MSFPGCMVRNMLSETITPRGERDADVELPPEPTTTLCYARLRAVCDADPSPAARATIREHLAPMLLAHIRSLCIALDALDGPDPESALLYMFDSITATRRALTALDGRLTGPALALVASVAHLVA
jgi:hypothetical protein